MGRARRSPMLDCGSEPYRVHLEIGGEAHPAVALELNGQCAALRSRGAVAPCEDVRLQLDWGDGATTSLPAVVRAVACAGRDHLVHVELTGVEGDWRRFLAFLGPAVAAR